MPRGDQLHGPEGGPQGLWLGGALPLEGGDLQCSRESGMSLPALRLCYIHPFVDHHIPRLRQGHAEMRPCAGLWWWHWGLEVRAGPGGEPACQARGAGSWELLRLASGEGQDGEPRPDAVRVASRGG